MCSKIQLKIQSKYEKKANVYNPRYTLSSVMLASGNYNEQQICLGFEPLTKILDTRVPLGIDTYTMEFHGPHVAYVNIRIYVQCCTMTL